MTLERSYYRPPLRAPMCPEQRRRWETVLGTLLCIVSVLVVVVK